MYIYVYILYIYIYIYIIDITQNLEILAFQFYKVRKICDC